MSLLQLDAPSQLTSSPHHHQWPSHGKIIRFFRRRAKRTYRALKTTTRRVRRLSDGGMIASMEKRAAPGDIPMDSFDTAEGLHKHVARRESSMDLDDKETETKQSLKQRKKILAGMIFLQ